MSLDGVAGKPRPVPPQRPVPPTPSGRPPTAVVSELASVLAARSPDDVGDSEPADSSRAQPTTPRSTGQPSSGVIPMATPAVGSAPSGTPTTNGTAAIAIATPLPVEESGASPLERRVAGEVHTLDTIAPPPPRQLRAAMKDSLSSASTGSIGTSVAASAASAASQSSTSLVNSGSPPIMGECPQCNTKGVPREFLHVHMERHCFKNLQLSGAAKERHRRNYGVSLANFRDLGGWEAVLRDRSNGVLVRGRIREGLIFRSSSINRASESDTRIIVKQLKVKSLLDLRTEEFAGKRGKHLSCFFQVMTRSGGGWVKKKKRPRIESGDVGGVDAAQSRELAQRLLTERPESENWGLASGGDESTGATTTTYDWTLEELQSDNVVEHGYCFPVGLVGTDFKRELISNAPKKNLVKAGLRYLKGQSPGAYRNAVVCHAFQHSDGLDVLYRMFVDYCEKEVLQFLMTLLAHAELPAIIYCNHGKDRTGYVCALILSICGVERQTILENYALSDEFLRPIASFVEVEMMEGGLLPAIMARSPIEVMRGTLNYIDGKHGSVQNYLSSIGFGPPLQELLFYRLVDLRIDAATPSPSLRSRRATHLSTDELRRMFAAAAASTAAAGEQDEAPPQRKLVPVWQPPNCSNDDDEALALPITGEPLTFSGVWSRPGTYELHAALLSDAAHFASVQLSLIYHSKGAVRTVISPPFVLHATASTLLLRPVFFTEPTERIDWRLMISGTATASPTLVSSKIFLIE